MCIHAQEELRVNWGISVVSEGQWNASNGKAGWMNMLQGDFGVELWKGSLFDISTLSTYGVGNPVCDDRQGLSNIDADNRAFRLFHAGLSQMFLNNRLFVFMGLKAADEDYFNTDMTGLFTGSSYGGNPICTEVHGISVYPEAALAFHVAYEQGGWTLRESLYNGAPSDRLDEQFRFRPGRDGVFNIGSVMYSEEKEEGFLPSTYTFGYAFSSKQVGGKEQFGLWGGVEQPLCRLGEVGLNLIAQGGVPVVNDAACKGYWAGALLAENVTEWGAQVGLSVNRCYWVDGRETDVELTLACPLGAGFSVQPAFHVIRTDGETNCVGLLRLYYEIGD
ncbi:MAG: carbohydrate porin [Bacteroidaceae bacterium]|nr:carbohydrate porin [Bacteroidaceae bacterium]